jgi:hypothetical protein
MKKIGQLIPRMAEAMLDEDYMSSHGNLKEWYENKEQESVQQNQEQRSPQVARPFRETGDEKRVAIQEPPKRRKISACFAPKDVVEGELQMAEKVQFQ